MIVGTNSIINDIFDVLYKFSIQEDVQLNYSQIENVDIQCNNLVKLSSDDRIEEIKTAIEKKLKNNKYIQDISFAGNNFINIILSEEYLEKNLLSDLSKLNGEKASILIDYGGPNIGKSLHVGHLRTLNIGRSIYKINKIAGNDVTSDIHLGDWGMPVALILCYIKKMNIKLSTLKHNDLETIYPAATELAEDDISFYEEAKNISKKLNENDEVLKKEWKIIYDVSVKNINELLHKLGHGFDWFYGESDVVKETKLVIDDAKLKNKIVDDNGALLSKEPSDPPILLTKSDGSYLYITTDLGTVYFREQNGNFDKYLYVVDQRQSNHFIQLFKTVKYFELSSSEFLHVSYGTVNGQDDKPLKTRDGGVYKLEELLNDVKKELLKKNSNTTLVEELANSILTYSDLLPSRNQNYKFDIEKFVDVNGKTGIYLQYAQVRAGKILSQYPTQNNKEVLDNLNEDERKLVFEITKLPYYFFKSLEKNEPHHIAEYAYSLCQIFNSFYSNNKIFSASISETVMNQRLFIVKSFYTTIHTVFELLGMSPVNEM
jgi:arginyl-tRNA synthetase|tara:strand:+ start:5776 stop:7410 length:1635 start_codon:yes stop_codon:yes gene_type:complete